MCKDCEHALAQQAVVDAVAKEDEERKAKAEKQIEEVRSILRSYEFGFSTASDCVNHIVLACLWR